MDNFVAKYHGSWRSLNSEVMGGRVSSLPVPTKKPRLRPELNASHLYLVLRSIPFFIEIQCIKQICCSRHSHLQILIVLDFEIEFYIVCDTHSARAFVPSVVNKTINVSVTHLVHPVNRI